MLSYSRENERYQIRIAELERRKNTCEASYAAIVTCWTQVSLPQSLAFMLNSGDWSHISLLRQSVY